MFLTICHKKNNKSSQKNTNWEREMLSLNEGFQKSLTFLADNDNVIFFKWQKALPKNFHLLRMLNDGFFC